MKLTITARYGAVDGVHTAPHTGVDLAMPSGTPLHTFIDGTVARVVDHGTNSIGKGVIVQQADGHTAIYGHLSRITVHKGDHISAGDLIGYSGDTGHSTGAHLHFGLMEHGHYVDPTPYLGQVASGVGGHGFIEHIQNGYNAIKQGITEVHDFSIGGYIVEKVTDWVSNGFADWVVNYATALPAVAVVCMGVYCLCRMFSKTVAKWAVLGVLVYGALTI